MEKGRNRIVLSDEETTFEIIKSVTRMLIANKPDNALLILQILHATLSGALTFTYAKIVADAVETVNHAERYVATHPHDVV